MRKAFRRQTVVHICLLMVSLAGLLATGILGQDAGEKPKRQLRLGYSGTTISKVDVNDAKVAMKLWTEKFSSEEGSNFAAEVFIFNSVDEMKQAVVRGEIDLVAMTTQEYLDLKNEIPLQPAYTAVVGTTQFDRLVLATHRDSPIKSIADLKGKRLNLENYGSGELSTMWLDCLLLRQKLPPSATFLQEVKTFDKASPAVLPVFFQKVEACIAREYSLSVLTELNPQIGKSLRIIEQSPLYQRGMVCFRQGFNKDWQDEITRSAFRLHESTKGQQILTLFKIDRIIPFDATALASVQELMTEHRSLMSKKP
ncbi:MAG TPA: PhnD/SsuA/transferrin family substrate-binding protein [Candidatus Ozemobacteraceae bacterium]|nr:PhnD/SsuA/transferrin family substrate-binding protein [Candidatus Ozemobacteraceae bacterium]